MNMELLEDLKVIEKVKEETKINNRTIYPFDLIVEETYEKPSMIDGSNAKKYSKDSVPAICKTLGNEESFEICKSIIDDVLRIRKSLNMASDSDSNLNLSEPVSNALKYIKEPERNHQKTLLTVKTKPKKCTRLVKIKNIHFKNKDPKNNLNKKLASYYDRAKSKCSNAANIQRNLYSDSVLNAVSRTRIPKKVLAKENLLDDIERISLSGNFNEDRISYISQSSDVTLIGLKSISSNNSELNNTPRIPSVIHISNCLPQIIQEPKEFRAPDSNVDNIYSASSKICSETYQNENLYSTNIIRVAVAQIENSSILKYKKEIASTNSRERFLVKKSLISAGSYMSQSDTVTSTSSLETLNTHDNERVVAAMGISDSFLSSDTLTDNPNIYDLRSESDKYVIAKTSSYFRNENILSNDTLAPMHEIYVKNDQNQAQTSPNMLNTTLLDTIINVGMFPKVTKSIQNNMFSSTLNDVIITDELRNSFPLNRLGIESTGENEYPKNVFKKSLSAEDDENRQKNINLPNEETINEILFNRNQVQKKSCSEESRNYTVFPELWEKLTVFIDVAIRKLEDNLMEKISQEMKKALDRIDHITHSNKRESKTSQYDIKERRESKEAIMISRMELGESKSLQCGSLQNDMLDELVRKMNMEGLKILKGPRTKLKEGYKILSSDLLEVLKAPVEASVSTAKGKGDSLAVSVSEGTTIKSSTQNSSLMKNAISFLKENALIIVSVPLFCLSLFLVYIFLAVLVQV
ncbi:uncharacterized protein LOC116775760 isoform X2 [Danaus plexippus]|uniref:uncharacterized protein LOC116775760 isoform X2 n=1 Tax=Danaus plexippus TaxID=13037 RepID=UPI002AAF27BF|nr:uncharacterized protein LOC116775760 isoform X2 [Danaus plexippus]